MGMTETLDTVLRDNIDIARLIRKLSFTDEETAEAARKQPQMFLSASIFRVQKLRKRQQREAKLKLIRSQYARKERRALIELGQRATDKQVEETLSRSKRIQKLERMLDKAVEEEEFAKLLLQSLQMRRDSIKALVELVGAEVYVARRMEGGGTGLDDIKEALRRKYPGKVAREERRSKR